MNNYSYFLVVAFVMLSLSIAFSQCVGTSRLDANFILENNDICEGGLVAVQNNTDEVNHEGIIYVWNWGDGAVDTVFNQSSVSHVYNFPDGDACSVQGGFEVVELRLDAILPNCPQFSHFVVKPVFVYYNPVADFEAEAAYICLPELSTTFENNTCTADSSAVYTWNFDDPASGSRNFSNEFEPTHTFSGPGIYNVSLTVESTCNVNTTFREVIVQESPRASARLPNATAFCAPTLINITNTSTNADEYKWSFSPTNGVNFFSGTDETTPDAQLVFQETGLFNIQLEAINECAIDTFTFAQPIEIQKTPTVSLSPVEPSCELLSYQPIAEISGEISGIIWEASGSQSFFSTDLIPDNFDFPPGNYTVKVSIENGCGIASDTDSTIIVYDRPDVNLFAVSPQCSNGLPIELPFSSSDTTGRWVGNGVSSNGIFNPQDSEVTIGINSLIYTAGVQGCQAIDTLDIEVRAAIEVNIGSDTAICYSEENLILSSTPGNGIWRGDGIISNDGIFNASNAGVGTHQLIYEVFDEANACFASATKTLEVEALPSVSIFQDTLFLCVNETSINLNENLNINIEGSPGVAIWRGLGIIDSLTGIFNTRLVDSTGRNTTSISLTYITNELGCQAMDNISIALRPLDTVTVQQDLVVCITDGLVRLRATPSFGSWTSIDMNNPINERTGIVELEQGGQYQYIFSIFENSSCTSKDTVRLDVIDMQALTNAGSDLSVCEGSTALIALSGFEPMNGTWTGTGVTNANLGVIDPSTLQAGQYTLYYEARNELLPRCSAVDSIQLTVDSLPLVAFELLDSILCQDTPIRFNNLSRGASQYEWRFTDSTSSNATNPQFTYSTNGLKSVELVAFSANNLNCKDSIGQVFNVVAPPMSANFRLSDSIVCVGTPVEFINQSRGENLTYQWNYGNDTTSTLENPPSMFYEQGERDTIYFPTLTVNNECGILSYSDTIRIFPKPIARFGTMLDTYCEGESVEIRNVSVGLPTAYTWIYGNGAISNDSLPIQPIYSVEQEAQRYTIQLNIQNECGMDSTIKEIFITPSNVEAFFNIEKQTFCVGDSIYLESFATPNVPVKWQFGDGNSTNLENPVYAYSQSGTYVISQLAFGCGYDSVGIEIQISDTPVASFEVEGGMCLGDTLRFKNNSSNVLSNIWNFGDGQERIIDEPVYAYQAAGNYMVNLIAQNNNCRDTFELPLSISSLPSFELVVQDTVCANTSNTFRVNVAEAHENYLWTINDSILFGRQINFTFSNNGQFEVAVSVQNSLGCTTGKTATVIALPQPLASFAIDALDLCTPAEVVFINTSTNANQFEWKFDQGNVVKTIDANLLYENEGDFSLDLIAGLNNQCFDTTRQTISIRQTPVLDFTIDDISCGGANDGRIEILNPQENFKYELFSNNYFQDSPSLFNNLMPNNYSLTVIAENGCDTTYQFNISEPQALAVDVIQDSIALRKADPVQIDVTYTPKGLNFRWIPDDFVSIVDSNRFVIAPRTSGYYLFEVSDGRCTASDSVYFDVANRNEVYLPTAFSPNGDGENDRFFVQAGLGIANVVSFQIFDRRGTLVFEANDFLPNDPLSGWDGTFKGEPLTPNVFTYLVQVQYKEGILQQLAGDVTLIR